jgi:serine/threonine protein kinase
MFFFFYLFLIKILGESLDDLHRHCNRQFSIVTVIQIAIQIISRLEILHKAGYVW